jgi:hypothetical protein
MAVCGRCGSIRVRAIARRGIAGLITALTGRDILTCGRCGWQGREKGAKGATRARSAKGARRRSRKDAEPTDVVRPPADIDLTALDRSLDDEKAS